MKKLVILIIVLLAGGIVAYKFFFNKEEKHAEIKDQALAIGKNSSVFNNSFGLVIADYFSLKDALVEWDTVKADQAAYALALKADSLPIRQLKGDSSILMTAASLMASISAEAKGLVGEGDIEQKRRGFNMLTDELYNVIRVVRYDGETIYHIRCPMAFKDSVEGFWLSNTPQIVNPYLGKKHPVYKQKMLGCGEVNDSLDFTKK